MAAGDPVRMMTVAPEPKPPSPEQLEVLQQRCAAADLSLIRREPEPDFFEEWESYVVEFPCGRDKRQIFLSDSDDVEALLSIQFEKFSFLSDYEVLVSRADQRLEAPVRPLAAPAARLLRLFGVEDLLDDAEQINAGTTIANCSKIFGGASVELKLQTPSRECRQLLRVSGRPGMLTLLISGLDLQTHDQATETLKKLSTALFVQIDASYGVALTLMPRRRTVVRRRRRPESTDPATITFPEQEYDDAPASLYFYGREAMRMPLLQFLAFYQTIEFYFPTYSQAAARRRIRNILKDPAFRPDRDSDLARVLTTIDPVGRFGLGDERAQLLATISECVDPQELRLFIEAAEDMKVFLSTKNKTLTDVRLPIENTELDLRQSVTERIYDIRCRIVHTKGTRRDVDLLLPNSKEAAMLGHDIELVQFLARKTLIAASSKLVI